MEIDKETSFLSQPSGNAFPDDPDLKEINIHVGKMAFRGFTSYPDFIAKTNSFTGKLNISHDPTWTTRVDLFVKGYAQVHFIFTEGERQELLVVYIENSLLKKLQEL